MPLIRRLGKIKALPFKESVKFSVSIGKVLWNYGHLDLYLGLTNCSYY